MWCPQLVRKSSSRTTSGKIYDTLCMVRRQEKIRSRFALKIQIPWRRFAVIWIQGTLKGVAAFSYFLKSFIFHPRRCVLRQERHATCLAATLTRFSKISTDTHPVNTSALSANVRKVSIQQADNIGKLPTSDNIHCSDIPPRALIHWMYRIGESYWLSFFF